MVKLLAADKGAFTVRMRTIVSLAVTAVLAASLLVVTSSPASAGQNNCPSGSVCMWEDANYSGDMYVSQPNVTGEYEIDWWNGDNEISSVTNYGNCVVSLWDGDLDAKGEGFGITPVGESRYQVPDLAATWGWDNRAESFSIRC